MTAIHCTNVAPSRKPKAISLFTWVADAFAARRQRNILKHLDQSRLEDIGVTYRTARKEANKPFWDVPSYWS